MKKYFYKAINFSGEVTKGTVEASNINELLNKSRSKGDYIFYKKIINKSNFLSTSRRIKSLDIAIFCKQLSVVLQCGIPLVEALTLISFQAATRELREAVSLLVIQIKCGESLYNGLKNSKYLFPEFMLQMIKAGEESGKLELVLMELSRYYERENKMNKKVIGSMIYPLITFIISFITIIILMITVVPSLTSELYSMGAKIPIITSIVMKLSAILTTNIFYIIPSIILMCIMLRIVGRNSNDFYKSVLMKLPMLSKLYKRILQIKFSRALSLLLGSGVNLILSIDLAARVLNNKKEQKSISKSIIEIKSGRSLYEALMHVKIFEPLFLSMIKIGEETGKLEEMLMKLVDIYEEETYDMMMRFIDFIQPVLIMIVACMVGIIVISVMLPITTLIEIV